MAGMSARRRRRGRLSTLGEAVGSTLRRHVSLVAVLGLLFQLWVPIAHHPARDPAAGADWVAALDMVGDPTAALTHSNGHRDPAKPDKPPPCPICLTLQASVFLPPAPAATPTTSARAVRIRHPRPAPAAARWINDASRARGRPYRCAVPRTGCRGRRQSAPLIRSARAASPRR
jgi:hypothetical protein